MDKKYESTVIMKHVITYNFDGTNPKRKDAVFH